MCERDPGFKTGCGQNIKCEIKYKKYMGLFCKGQGPKKKKKKMKKVNYTTFFFNFFALLPPGAPWELPPGVVSKPLGKIKV